MSQHVGLRRVTGAAIANVKDKNVIFHAISRKSARSYSRKAVLWTYTLHMNMADISQNIYFDQSKEVFFQDQAGVTRVYRSCRETAKARELRKKGTEAINISFVFLIITLGYTLSMFQTMCGRSARALGPMRFINPRFTLVQPLA